MAISEGTLAIGSRVMLPNGSTNNSLSELNDVNISNVSNNQLLQYDSSLNKWKNIDAESIGTKILVMPKYVKVAEANANQTFATQLSQLATAFTNLTDIQKTTSLIMMAGVIYKCSDITNGRFSNITVADSVYIATFSLTGNTYKTIAGSFSITDKANNTNTNKLELWALQ